MKKILLFMLTAVLVASCGSDDNGPELVEYVLDFEGSGMKALIDDPQYNGPLIYSDKEYKWSEDGLFSGEVEKADWSEWGMGYGWNSGAAISNYVEKDHSKGDYLHQLAIPVGEGNNQFAVIYNEATITLASATPVYYLEVCPTTYLLANEEQNLLGDENAWFAVIITGYKDGVKTNSVTAYLAQNGELYSSWTPVDITSLGTVDKITFTFDGSDKGAYGLNTPKYVAIDNLTAFKTIY